MGYRTYFNLWVLDKDGLDTLTDDEQNSIIKVLREDSEGAGYALEEDGSANGDCTWYDYAEEMKEFSTQYPDNVFKMYGVGEENDDIWYSYFKNGKQQWCPAVITFDAYDEEKLDYD